MGTVVSVSTPERVAALTFDDGPDPDSTTAVAGILERWDARGTFFVVGEHLAGNERVIDRLTSSGHAVCVHGWSHVSACDPHTGKGWRRERAQIRSVAEALAGSGSRFYRPPYGHESPFTRIAALSCGHRVVGWSVSAGDWARSESEQIVERIEAKLRPGAIVLLHDRLYDAATPDDFDRSFMHNALERLLERDGGQTRFVTVPELMRLGRQRVRFRILPPAPLPALARASA